MSSNSIAISRELLAAGVEQKTANAVAEAIVKHSNDHYAAKVEILELKSSLKEENNALRNQLNAFQAEIKAKLEGAEKKNDSRFNLLTIIVVIGDFGALY